MELGDYNPLNPNTLSRLPIVAGAIRDVIHDRYVTSRAILNHGSGFGLTPEQEKVWNDGPIILADAMERRQTSESI